MKTPETWNNLVEMFLDQAAKYGRSPFLWFKSNGAWRSISWQETADRVARLAGSLKELGIKAGDRVALVSENRPEWLIADMAIMAIGAITVPAYTTNTERDHHHILENSGAVAAIVSGPKLAKTLLPAVYQSTHCRIVIGIEPLRIGQSSIAQLYDWQSLIAASSTTVDDIRQALTAKRADLACLIYTSGTGGAPRGVRQHHGAILCNVDGAADVVRNDFPRSSDVFLSFLPLSHAYEHTGGQFLPIALGAQIYYAEGLDKLAANIEEARPTIMVVVPRLFELLRTRITKAIEKQGKIAIFLFSLAVRFGKEKYETGQLSWWKIWVDRLLDMTVRKKAQARFGGRLKALVSGGAPLSPDVGIFFFAIGLPLLQGYGQTEAAPIISCNRPKRGIKMHSVGPALKGVEVKIAEDGEILVRGELVTQGYWQNEEETARILEGGWLHTGDIGLLDSDGHIVITDRKKDIIVNDKGDNVSPQKIEGMLTLEPEIMQAMVFGDKRPHLVGLVVPDPEWLTEWARVRGKRYDLGQLKGDAELHKALQAAVDRVNTRLSVTEKVRRIALADAAFTVENEQMTPTLKIRRHVIKQNYGERLESLYG